MGGSVAVSEAISPSGMFQKHTKRPPQEMNAYSEVARLLMSLTRPAHSKY